MIIIKTLNLIKNEWISFKNEAIECLKELKNKKIRRRQIPNILTASRLLSPILIIPFIIFKNYLLTFIFISIFTLTDALDGILARKMNSKSEFGRKLDPIADKVFAISLLIPLLSYNKLIGMIMLFEIIISIINFYSKINGNKTYTNFYGKIKTFLLTLTIILEYFYKFLEIKPNYINNLLYLTIIIQIFAAIKYYLIYKKKQF